MSTLVEALQTTEPALRSVLLACADAAADCSAALRKSETYLAGAGEANAFGDVQCRADVVTNDLFFASLQACEAVASAASEEASTPRLLHQGGSVSVSFDPLDGSSVLDAGLAVGSIVGVWPGATFVGLTGRQQLAALYVVYGPRTLLVLAVGGKVSQFCLSEGRSWLRTHSQLQLKGAMKLVAPANARCASENEAYRVLLARLFEEHFTLRYSGALVPDVHHLLSKGGGVFISPASPSHPAKLRLLFEAAPMAFVVEAAGGHSCDDSGQSILDVLVTHAEQRSALCLGAPWLVAEAAAAMSQNF